MLSTMTVEQARELMPRFLAAVTGLAKAQESSLARRLAWIVDQVAVFNGSYFPKELRPKIDELHRLLASRRVPIGAEMHPKYPLRVPVAYLRR